MVFTKLFFGLFAIISLAFVEHCANRWLQHLRFIKWIHQSKDQVLSGIRSKIALIIIRCVWLYKNVQKDNYLKLKVWSEALLNPNFYN